MAISGPSSYLPTTDLFLAHWQAANTALGAQGPIVLQGGKARADLLSLRETLEQRRAAVEDARNELEGKRADLAAAKAALLARLNQFNGKLESLSGESRWTAMAPKAFSVSDGMGKVIRPLDDMASIWLRYENEESAFPLMGGYSRLNFVAALSGLKALYSAYADAETALGLIRGQRNETQEEIYAILKAYRKRIPSEFAEGSAILTTLPKLTPPPGHTPAPVQASGAWNAATQVAELAWSAVTDAAVVSVEVRATAGPEYDPDDESVLATLAPDAPRTWTGNFGLGVPRAMAAFKVYLLTAEGNERGSNTVVIQRPE